jgi:hypothetical protein
MIPPRRFWEDSGLVASLSRPAQTHLSWTGYFSIPPADFGITGHGLSRSLAARNWLCLYPKYSRIHAEKNRPAGRGKQGTPVRTRKLLVSGLARADVRCALMGSPDGLNYAQDADVVLEHRSR